MRTISILASACTLLLTFSCQQEAQFSESRSNYTDKDYGELPPLPNGEKLAKDPKFVSLLKPSGQFKDAKIGNAKSAFAVGTKEGGTLSCSLPQDAALMLVASVVSDRGNRYFIAHIPHACDAEAIGEAPKGEKLLEGYVHESNVVDPDAIDPDEPMPPVGPTIAPEDGCQKAEQFFTSNKDNNPERNVQTCSSATAAQGSTPSSVVDKYTTQGRECGVPGNVFRTTPEQVHLKLTFGQENVAEKLKKVRFKVSCLANECYSQSDKSSKAGVVLPEVTLNASDLKSDDPKIFNVDFSKFIPVGSPARQWYSSRIEIAVTGLAADDQPLPQVCKHNIRLASPIVLNLSAAQTLATIHPAESKVMFDLDNDGVKEKSGWIKGATGFLAMDRNGNGKIDNGGELFGNFTRNSIGQSFENGYLALADLAGNSKGFIEKGDAAFAKLRVWTDKNQDGVSQKRELKTLEQLQITRIDYQYSKYDDGATLAFGNRIPYSAKFYGPTYCPKSGCASFDVFFGTISDVNVSSVSK